MDYVENKLEYLAIERLKAAKRNARTHSRKQISQISRSIEKFGFTNPILIDDDERVVAGHGRLAAAQELDLETVPCIRLRNLSDADKRAYIIADNKLALNAGWDIETLAMELGELLDLDLDISVTGFDEVEVDSILSLATEASPEPMQPENKSPRPTSAACVVSRLGDIWTMGRHILLCGDAKDMASLDRLMGNDKADMIFTDPPYNVPISGHVSGLGRTKHREFHQASGEMSVAQFTEFLAASFREMERVSRNGAIVFTCMDWRHLREVLDAGHSVFNELKNICVWSKTNGGMGTFYRSQHELILVWKVGDLPHRNNFGLGEKGRYRTNVWTYPGVNSFGSERMRDLASHPTVKPVALVEDAIRDVSNRGEIVLDSFGGSGTTLIAAEKSGRRARIIEIDPAYCDVIIRRWQTFTGKQASLAGVARTFEEVATDRLTDCRSDFARSAA